jgi:Ca2+-binding RTX toxin-like protein
MTIDTTTLSGLSKLMLVACDMSYKGIAAQPNEDLASYPDTPSYEFPLPYDISNNGFKVLKADEISKTGFKVVIFSKDNELIVAMAGTDGPNMQDWAANVRLGWDQWNGAFDTATNTVVAGTSGRDRVIPIIQDFLAGLSVEQQQTARIHFTGQSLGGALADYAAYEWVKILGNSAANVALTTFNGLGSKEGLVKYGGEKQTDVNGFGGLASVAHYFVTNDLVSRLGGGHLAGAGNTYEFTFLSDKIDPRTGKPYLLDPVTAHRIETGFYQQFGKSGNPENVFNEATPSTPTLIVAGKAADVAAQLIGLFNSKGTTELSARYRALAGLTAAISKVEASSELEPLLDPIIDALRDSNLIDSGLVRFLRTQGASELKRAAQHSQYVAVTQMLTALVLEKAASITIPGDADILALRQLLSPQVVNTDLSSAFYGLPSIDRAIRIAAGLELIDPNSPRWGAADREALSRLGISVDEVTRKLFAGASEVDPAHDDFQTYLFQRLKQNGQIWDATKAYYRLRKAFSGAISEIERDYRPTLSIDGIDSTAFNSEIDRLENDLTQQSIDVAEAIANSNADLFRKFSDPLSLDVTTSNTDYRKIVVATNELLRDQTLDASLRLDVKNAVELIKGAGQRPVVESFAAKPTNPFNDPTFDPDTAAPAADEIADGAAGTYTIFLPYEAGEGGQRVRLTLEGVDIDKLTVLSGGKSVPISGSSFDLTVAQGRKEVSFALEVADDLGLSGALAVSATLVDASGVATHLTHLEASLTLTHQDQTFSSVFDAATATDFASADRINGFFSGNDPTQVRTRLIGTSRGDLFIGDHASESIVGSAGNDYVMEGAGAGTGAYVAGDAIDAGSGNDVISGRLGARVSAGDGDDFVNANDLVQLPASRLDAGHQQSFAELPAAIYADLAPFMRFRSTAADPAFNPLVGSLDFAYVRDFGNNNVGSPINGVSAKMGVVSVGSGSEIQRTAAGGAAFQLTAFNSAATIKYLGATTPLTYTVSFTSTGDLHNTQDVEIDGGAGNDLLYGAGGEDFLRGGTGDDRIAGFAGDDTLEGDDGADQIVAGGGDDYVDAGAGDDRLWGEGGNDGLWGGEGNDVIFGDSTTTPIALQGNDYLDGGAGDDQLVGNGGADELFGGEGNDLLDGGDGNDYLDGEAGNDTLLAGAGDDELFGGEGDDVLTAADGVDYLDGEAGNDQLDGGAGNDTLFGGDGTDVLTGGVGDDLLDGEAGSDQLAAGDGNDTLYGSEGNDRLQGGAGNDQLDGGAGDNVLLGDAGDDTYVLALGDGLNVIDDQLGVNRIVFGDGIFASDVVAAYTDSAFGPQDLVLSYGGASRTWVRGGGATIGSLQFADSTTLSLTQFLATNLVPGFERRTNILVGTAASDTLTDTSGMDIVAYGLEGNDSVITGAGNDVFYGGPGNDGFVGGKGNDTYQFSRGDGQDRVIDSDSTAGNVDRIVYASDISPSQIQVTRTDNDLVLKLSSATDQVTVASYFENDAATPSSIERIEFLSDGTAWDVETVKTKALIGTAGDDTLTGYASNDVLSGLAGNDTLNGNAGDDLLDGGPGADLMSGGAGNDTLIGGETLFGGTGDDTYVFSRGSGTAHIDEEDASLPNGGFDTILVSADIAPSEVQLRRPTSQNLELRLADGSNLTVDRQYNPDSTLAEPIEQIRFASDGTTWDLATIWSIVNTPTNGADSFWGTNGDDVLEGKGGDDFLQGGKGGDTYLFNLGDGHDRIFEYGTFFPAAIDGGTDRIVFGPGITPTTVTAAKTITFGRGNLLLTLNGSDSIFIENYFGSTDSVPSLVEEIRFQDGTVWTDETMAARFPIIGNDFFGSPFRFDELISGLWVADVIFAGAGKDSVSGKGGNDVIHGGDGDDQLIGGMGDDRLFGEAGNDVLGEGVNFGLPGNNMMDGGPGDDVLVGLDGGNDLLIGGTGNDRFFFGFGSKVDIIEDLDTTPGNVDTIIVNAAPDQITGSHTATHRILALNAQDQLFIRWDPAGGYQVEQVQFNNGTVWDVATLLAKTATEVITNHPPVVSSAIPDQAAQEDAGFSFSIPANTFSDPDAGDTLTLAATTSDGSPLPAWLSFSAAATAFSGTPAQADVGALDIRVTATDSKGLFTQDTFTLTVAPTNDAPVVSSPIADQSALEDVPFSLVVPASTFADVDPGDTLTYSAARADGSALPGWLSFDAATGAFSGTPLQDDVGVLQVRLTATDTGGLSAADTFDITVANVNDAPTLASLISDQTALEDQAFSFTVPPGTFADEDPGDTMSFAASMVNGEALPGWLSFDPATRTFSGTSSNDDVGVFDVRVIATDAAGASVSDRFAMTVLNTNDAPTLVQALADQAATEDQPFSLALPAGMFSDVDAGDVLILSAMRSDGSALPSWLSFDASSGVFSGTPRNADVGTVEISIDATDTAGASAQDRFNLSVANVNDAPIVANPLQDQSFVAGSPFVFAVPANTFADEDAGDSLTLNASLFGGGALPSWLAFNAATGTFTGSPTTADIGVSHLVVGATDTSGSSASSDFGLIVHAIAGSSVTGGAGNDILYGASGDETLTARGGNDALFGGAGNDLLRGGSGADVLQGGEGQDILRGGGGQNVLDAGAGNDLVFGANSSELIAGGAGDDTLRTGQGHDVILFNRGDGSDTVISGGVADNTLSFGGGIGYNDLSLAKSGNDLIVNAGGNDKVLLKDWYAGSNSVLNLQVILDATTAFDASSSDPLYNKRVQSYDFLGLVSAFDQSRAQSPGLSSWALTNALLQFHLSGSDDAALGGDLAYWYGRNGSLSGISLQAAQQVIGAAGFGSDAQQLHAFSGLQDGLVKLS